MARVAVIIEGECRGKEFHRISGASEKRRKLRKARHFQTEQAGALKLVNDEL
jgi:hypothetical protein